MLPRRGAQLRGRAQNTYVGGRGCDAGWPLRAFARQWRQPGAGPRTRQYEDAGADDGCGGHHGQAKQPHHLRAKERRASGSCLCIGGVVSSSVEGTQHAQRASGDTAQRDAHLLELCRTLTRRLVRHTPTDSTHPAWPVEEVVRCGSHCLLALDADKVRRHGCCVVGA
jgi:hypothetical protein